MYWVTRQSCGATVLRTKLFVKIKRLFRGEMVSFLVVQMGPVLDVLRILLIIRLKEMKKQQQMTSGTAESSINALCMVCLLFDYDPHLGEAPNNFGVHKCWRSGAKSGPQVT